ncbi:MAG TPA: hypothetical protein VN363_00865 [Anaerolineales bacterium]|nr:hypothetical protein [Anaerolineales bacterium]
MPKIIGYLPNDTPPIGQIILPGFQHALTMFPATRLARKLPVKPSYLERLK